MNIFRNFFRKPAKKSEGKHPSVSEVFSELESLRRQASIAQIGGFKPPEDFCSSWFGGHAVSLPDEGIPEHNGEPMFPLLQINTSELTYVPEQLQEVALLVVWLNANEIPFDEPHGNGWLIREYQNLDGLQTVEDLKVPEFLKSFPIKWSLSETEGPGWEDAWELVDLESVNESEEASEEFFDRFQNHSGTKVGGYPSDIQHGLGGDGDFVFQIGSEEKPNWMWADNGIGYFLKTENGDWEFQCQFY